MKKYILALDQGTTSSRALVFDAQLNIVASAQQEFTQFFPQPGWVEHDANEIWASTRQCIEAVLTQIDATQIAAIGITNQRETTVVWERATGRPIHRALVWQDRRTEDWCAAQRAAGLTDTVRAKTGLVLDPYFSASKIDWLLNHVPNARNRAEQGELAFGTIDSWLLWNLTQGKAHTTDVTNASRTLLWNLHAQHWDQDLLRQWNIPAALLPTVHPSQHLFGETTLFGAPIPIFGIAGDQQAATFGQGCVAPGQAKNTYGTGCFLLLHTGAQAVASQHGLLTTAAAQTGATPQYALEGSVFIGGAVVQWLRDGLGLIEKSSEVEALARQVPDSGGVVLVPAFTGLGAPYWNAHARGSLLGLTRGSTRAHIARAALEAIAFQSAELVHALAQDSGQKLTALRVDGGACANDLLMQMQADLLGIPVERPRVLESTALGAALLAGLGAGLWPSHATALARIAIERTFTPQIPAAQAAEKMQRWQAAVRATLQFADLG